MHSTDNLDDGYLGSGRRLQRSIKKHGEQNHFREILQIFETRNEMIEEEKRIVNEDLLQDPLCMNLTVGGFGGWFYENSNSETQRRKNRKSNSKQQELALDPIWRKIKANTQSSINHERYKNGAIAFGGKQAAAFKGRIHSDATKKMIGQKNSVYQTGSGNSQFGTCWVMNHEKSIKISKNDLKKYLDLGFKKGRKITRR